MHRRIAATLSALLAVAGVAAVVAASADAGRGHNTAARAAGVSRVAQDIAVARSATTKYVTNLGRAKADGYGIITRRITNMGWHFMNPSVKGFDVRRPQILVYERQGNRWQLGALEWVFTKKPAKNPLPGARYGAFGAACHYVDGTVVPATAESQCAPRAPGTHAKFNFWHPNLVTLHFWVWYPNPSGLFSGTNPLVTPFNAG